VILSRPSPDYKTLFLNREPVSLTFDNLSFYSSGRYALLAALEKLKVKAESVILLPAYICDSVVATLTSAGFRIVFMDIQKDLQLDPSDVEMMVELHDVKVLLVVHYFGFPCELSQIVQQCRNRNVKVIEDCCHSFLTSERGVPIGKKGDAAIFSLRKTFPVDDGGALQLNKPYTHELNKDILLKKPNSNAYLLKRVLEKLVARSGLVNLYSPSIDALKRRIFGSKMNGVIREIQPVDLLKTKPSFQLKRYLGSQAYHQKIQLKVAGNYQYLARLLTDSALKPIVPLLSPGCVPQWIPCFDASGKSVDWLRSKGVGASRWPWHELPVEVKSAEEKYPVSCELDRKLALLPIHQSVQLADLRKISLLVDEFSNHV
jgi:hypothetical protein